MRQATLESYRVNPGDFDCSVLVEAVVRLQKAQKILRAVTLDPAVHRRPPADRSSGMRLLKNRRAVADHQLAGGRAARVQG